MTSVKKVSMLCVLWLRSNDPDIWFITSIAKNADQSYFWLFRLVNFEISIGYHLNHEIYRNFIIFD